jgi:non-ribosomal peptide synthetase component F
VARRTLAFDAACFARLRQLARRRKTTPFVILIAAVDVWLYRMTHCRDLRVGTLVANRGLPGAERVIGYFANAVVLRARLAPRMTFAEVIEQAHDALRGALAHSDLPIEMLARSLQKKRARRRATMFQALVNYRRFDFKRHKIAGLTIASSSHMERAAAPEVAFTSADINFEFREASQKLTLSVNFKAELFDATALSPLIESYAKVVEQGIARPDRRLADFILAQIG